MNFLKHSKSLTAVFVMAVIFLPVYAFSATIQFYLGDVSVIRNGKQIAVSMGTVVNNGDTVKTGPQATAEILYEDGSKITVKSGSKVVIGSNNIEGSDNPSLIAGNLTGKFAKLKKGQRKVYTPTVVCAIRGTEFDVSVSKSGESRVDLAEGKLEIANPYGKTDLEPNQKIEAGVAAGPLKGKADGNAENWQKNSDESFDKDPADTGKKYNKYMDKLSEEGKNDSKNMGKYGDMVKNASDPKGLEKAGGEIDAAAEGMEDDMMINQAANSSVSDIMEGGAGNKKAMSLFEQVKNKSNGLLDVQKQNYAQIQAVKAAYKEAYDKIMGQYKEDKKKIMQGIDFDSVKPKFEKNK